MTPSVPVFPNKINALGDFRGGVKVARDFTRQQRLGLSEVCKKVANLCFDMLVADGGSLPAFLFARPMQMGKPDRG